MYRQKFKIYCFDFPWRDQPDNADKQLAALKKAHPFFGKCEEFEDLKQAIEAYKAKRNR